MSGSSFPFPPSPHPTVHDVDDEDMTDGSCSEDESYDESDEEMEEEGQQAAPNIGRPREFGVAPASAQPQVNPGVSGPPKPPGQPGSLDVLTEIRKMIKEECARTPSPSLLSSTGLTSSQ
jgi:hypothetical protein